MALRCSLPPSPTRHLSSFFSSSSSFSFLVLSLLLSFSSFRFKVSFEFVVAFIVYLFLWCLFNESWSSSPMTTFADKRKKKGFGWYERRCGSPSTLMSNWSIAYCFVFSKWNLHVITTLCIQPPPLFRNSIIGMSEFFATKLTRQKEFTPSEGWGRSRGSGGEGCDMSFQCSCHFSIWVHHIYEKPNY